MLSHTTPKATVQQVLLKHHSMSANVHVQKVLDRLKACRTAALGYHLYRCSDEECGKIKYQYHSCRDRHCPQCGAVKKEEWIENRTQELLRVKYYHVVFTLPHELNSLILSNRKLLYQLLFDVSAGTLLSFAKDKKFLGATPGIISVLHTWGQQLSFHPHMHSIVSGGGLADDNTWKDAKKNIYRFLFPIKAMSIVYRSKFLQALKQLIDKGKVILPDKTEAKQLLDLLYQKDWVVYAKAPFGGPQAVIEYLGRYTHKVAISNHRISSINDDDTVTFAYKDYADQGKKKLMTLSTAEFIRRFEQHILPKRFTKIRTYGYLANRNRHKRVGEVLKKMKLPLHKGLVKIPLELRLKQHYGIDINQCPCCKQKTLHLLKIVYPACNKIEDG
ncbi:MAG: IS91 family transposase [Bacteroidota bacterium]|nr:IS91 family transposase [Bacteroidota bacterium]